MPDPTEPQDPFPATHAGFVAILEMYRNFRGAGGGWVESALLVAAVMAVNLRTGQDETST